MKTGKKILIVDDDSFLLDMYSLKFTQEEFEVKTALGPESALEILRGGFNPEVVLLDIVMPMMNGFELLEKIKEEGLAKNAKKIILSNRGQSKDIEDGKKYGADGFIVKANNTPAEVIERVKEALLK